MKKNLFLLLFSITLFIGCGKAESVIKPDGPVIENPEKDDEETRVAKQILEAKWTKTEVSSNITYKYHHFKDLYSSNQSITILDVDLNKNTTVDIPFVSSGFLKTSNAAINSRATAAINGSFFNTSTGGSTVFFRRNGEIIKTTNSGFSPHRENAGLNIDASGKVSIIAKPASGWENVTTNTLLASGPLLVFQESIVKQKNFEFNTLRHPRTAVGITKDNHLIAVVVDGRSTQAHGMTIEELATLMDVLGCEEAMNLDGGGSSTAWIRNRGVVNYPSDNKKFDHEGERGVATVVTFMSK